jgi:hypothetical protein
MQSEIKVGQRFKFTLSDDPSQERQAVVTRVPYSLIVRKDSGRRWDSILHIG